MSINHPNVIKIYREFTDGVFAYIIMELCEGGSLLEFVKKNHPLSPNQIGQFCFQLAIAIQCCHNHGIAHNDIKPHNVLLDSNNRVRLTDFGISTKQEKDQFVKLKTGTLSFMAPERFTTKPFDPFKADLWAFGVTVYYLSQGRTPWLCDKPEGIKSEIQSFSLSIPPSMNQSIGTIVAKLMKHDPYLRVPIETLLDLDFLKQLTFGVGDKGRVKLQPAATNLILARRGSRVQLSLNRRSSIANLKKIGGQENLGLKTQSPILSSSIETFVDIE